MDFYQLETPEGLVDARFSLAPEYEDETDGALLGLSIFIPSSGGGYNREYNRGLGLLIERLHERFDVRISSVLVERKHEKRSEDERRIAFEHDDERSHEETRKAIQKAAAKHGRPEGAKGGGNGQKAIRLRLSSRLPANASSYSFFARLIGAVPAKGAK